MTILNFGKTFHATTLNFPQKFPWKLSKFVENSRNLETAQVNSRKQREESFGLMCFRIFNQLFNYYNKISPKTQFNN